MHANTWRMVRTIADNSQRELLRRGLPAFFAAIFAVCLLWLHLNESEYAPYHYLLARVDRTLSVASYVAFVWTASFYQREISRRTLVAVMAHPVDPWMHLCGRILGMVFWYTVLSALVLLTACGMCGYLGVGIELDLPGVVAQNLALGVTWIVLGGTIGALTNQWAAIGMVVVLTAARNYPGFGPGTAAHVVFYALSLLGPGPDAAHSPIAKFELLRVVDNLLYAAVIFIGGAAILERRDIPTRGV